LNLASQRATMIFFLETNEPIFNEVVEKCLYTDRFNTTPDRVGPPGIEIEQEKVLARNPLVRSPCGGTDLNQTMLSTTAWPIGTAPSISGLAIGVVEKCLYTDRFNTSPDRVGPPRTEIEQEKVLETNSARNPLVRSPYGGPDLNQEMLSTTAWPIGTAPSISGLASTSGTYAAQTPSWTALFTHSMSVLSGSGEISADKVGW
jgi:hypothetical protein